MRMTDLSNAGCPTKGWKATQRVLVHHLQGESSTQAATELEALVDFNLPFTSFFSNYSHER
jgi:hypothetical protein